MADIFISYARADRDKIEKLAAALEAEGYSVWWDRNIEGGSEFSKDIERELEAARAVIVAWSRAACESRWVKDEANVAAEDGKLIAISLHGGEPPIGFRQFHALPYSNDTPDSFERLKRTLSSKVCGSSPVRAGTAAKLSTPAKSVAVLAFMDMSAEGDQGYFADGMAEEILNVLAKSKDLRVAGRTSSFSFKDKNESLKTIGRTLNVEHILEGSVRKQGEKIRITAQLINAADESHLWSENFDGTLTDIFALQDDVARHVADALETVLGAQGGSAEPSTENENAYDLFLKGRALYRKNFNKEISEEAMAMLERAVFLDPEFAQAWAEIGIVKYTLLGWFSGDAKNALAADGETALRKALTIDPSLASAQAILAMFYAVRHEYVEAMALVDVAFANEPNNPDVNLYRGLLFTIAGHSRSGVEALTRASQIDPLHAMAMQQLARAEHNAGFLDASDEHARAAVDLGVFTANEILARNAHIRGETDLANAYLMKIYEDGADQLTTDFGSRELWEMVSGAFYRNSAADRSALTGYAKAYLNSNPAEVGGILQVFLVRLGEASLYFKNYEKSAGTGFASLMTLWDDSDGAVRVRQHKDFMNFAERAGLKRFWDIYGWPDKLAHITDEGDVSSGVVSGT